MTSPANNNLQTFGEHLDSLRKVLFRIVMVVLVLSIVMFALKNTLFELILAPCSPDFVTFKFVNEILGFVGIDNQLYKDDIGLITTGLSSQFMAHMSLALYMGLLVTSPYIVYELFGYVSPALHEKKHSIRLGLAVYLLFIMGLLLSYFILFPVACRFLATYHVSERVSAMISLDSYISTFVSLTIMMGIVFQLPIIALIMAKLGLIDNVIMKQYRKHVFIVILLLAAIITPPDVMTLILVSAPLYFLYEFSIIIVKLNLATAKKK
jgi:sec-independent protein translocase protein TatC